jgi:hypothetical protein
MKLRMAVKQQHIAKVKPSRKNTTAATRKNGSKHTASKATARRVGRKKYDSKQQQPTPANVSEIRPGDGGREFIKAFNQIVAAESLAIAEAIVAKVKLGNISGARFLDEITGAKAQRNQPPQKPHRPLLPFTPEQLAAQPKWQEPSDPEVDTGLGGHEPEN